MNCEDYRKYNNIFSLIIKMSEERQMEDSMSETRKNIRYLTSKYILYNKYAYNLYHKTVPCYRWDTRDTIQILV